MKSGVDAKPLSTKFGLLKEKLRENLDNLLDIQDILLWWLYLILKDNWCEINHFSW